MEHKKCRQTFAVQHRGDTFNTLNCGFAVDFSGARPRHWKSECLSTQSPRVFSARSSGNCYGETNSQHTARHDASSVNTSTSSSTQSGGIQPTEISAQSSLNFVGNHVNSRESQPVHEMRASSVDDSFCQMMIRINVCRHANMKIVPIHTKWRSSPR